MTFNVLLLVQLIFFRNNGYFFKTLLLKKMPIQGKESGVPRNLVALKDRGLVFRVSFFSLAEQNDVRVLKTLVTLFSPLLQKRTMVI